jgi:hypothetical protein
LTVLSTEDLEAMLAIVEKYEPRAGELAASGDIPFQAASGVVGRDGALGPARLAGR